MATKKNRRNLKKTVKQLNCSPFVKNKHVVSNSCMTSEVLLKIRDEYNKDHNKKIVATKPALIWHELRMKLDTKDERKWVNEIDDPKLRTQIKKQLFAPEHPPEWLKNPNEWLTNYDIDLVMEQYEMENKDFKYLGTTPIDYDYIVDTRTHTCVEDDLCKFNLKELMSQGKRRFASVFNLDKHDQSGSHWVSVFIDVNKRIIMFFDSASGPVPKKIAEFINSVKEQGLRLCTIKTPTLSAVISEQGGADCAFQMRNGVKENIEFKYIAGKKKHQYGGTECGVYSIHFIIQMLAQPDKAMQVFLYGKIPDKEVEKYRKKYFNSPENV